VRALAEDKRGGGEGGEKKKNQKKRDAEIPTAPSKEKSSRNRRTVVECTRAMCFLLGVW